MALEGLIKVVSVYVLHGLCIHIMHWGHAKKKSVLNGMSENAPLDFKQLELACVFAATGTGRNSGKQASLQQLRNWGNHQPALFPSPSLRPKAAPAFLT